MSDDSYLYDVVDAVAQGSKASDITQAIKSALYDKAMARVDAFKPEAAARMFGIEPNSKPDIQVDEEPTEVVKLEDEGEEEE